MSMTRNSPPRLLASVLADAARSVAGTVGDRDAQALVYGLLLRRWEAGVQEQVRAAPGAALDSVERLLDQADLESVRGHYAARGMDPAVYFYEEFTRACEPAAARKRGVHYSPPEVVGFMVRAAESILQTEFGESLADAAVVDPCCGIGTFLRHIERRTPLASPLKGGDCPNPIASPSEGEKIGVELSAAAAQLAACLLPGSRIVHGDWLGGVDVDTNGRTLVVIGNPPYSGHSANPGKIASLMADYRLNLSERNPKWLQDDYVKFIRMAQHHVVQAGRGIVAFITNHSYLFNPTFRAMRESLMRDFDLIYALDLHGNSRRNDEIEENDENVFPIQMGVAISLMVRRGSDRTRQSPGLVRYAEMRGGRAQKLSRLASARLEDLPWTDVACMRPFQVFLPRDDDLSEEYAAFPSILDLFGQRSVGFVTSRDAFAVDTDREALLTRIAALRDSQLTPDDLIAAYPVGDLNVDRFRLTLQADRSWDERAIRVLYRPFDVRWVYYSPEIMERPRLPFMNLMMRDNVAIVVGRAGQATGSEVWDVAFCADKPVDLNLFRRGGATILPRYLYDGPSRLSNIKDSGMPADLLFHYVYCILWSSEYRARYADFLKLDYPRIPIPRDGSLPRTLSDMGRELVRVHLTQEPPTSQPRAAALSANARLTIGGYDIPGKYIADRREAALSASEAAHVESIRLAASATMRLQAQIDEVVRSQPPWSQT
jgi:predicted helicase